VANGSVPNVLVGYANKPVTVWGLNTCRGLVWLTNKFLPDLMKRGKPCVNYLTHGMSAFTRLSVIPRSCITAFSCTDHSSKWICVWSFGYIGLKKQLQQYVSTFVARRCVSRTLYCLTQSMKTSRISFSRIPLYIVLISSCIALQSRNTTYST
jgi:hypothetical protein